MDEIRQVKKTDIKDCVDIIRKSFMTVAEELGFTEENAPRFTAFATTEERLSWHFEHAFSEAQKMGCSVINIGIVEENVRLWEWYEASGAEHIGTKKYDFFPFTCGYMRKKL